LTEAAFRVANGGAYSLSVQAAGGSGGTVSVTTGVLVGAGVFESNGGSGGEAAGGGRVAVYYNARSSNFTGFTGPTASGGSCGNNCSNGATHAPEPVRPAKLPKILPAVQITAEAGPQLRQRPRVVLRLHEDEHYRLGSPESNG
jgi:hypothetical protein